MEYKMNTEDESNKFPFNVQYVPEDITCNGKAFYVTFFNFVCYCIHKASKNILR